MYSCTEWPGRDDTAHTKDLEISRLAAYWPAPIHAVALLAYTVVT